jgi:hypothetical protein
MDTAVLHESNDDVDCSPTCQTLPTEQVKMMICLDDKCLSFASPALSLTFAGSPPALRQSLPFPHTPLDWHAYPTDSELGCALA